MRALLIIALFLMGILLMKIRNRIEKAEVWVKKIELEDNEVKCKNKSPEHLEGK